MDFSGNSEFDRAFVADDQNNWSSFDKPFGAKSGRYNLAAEFLHPVVPLKSPLAYEQLYSGKTKEQREAATKMMKRKAQLVFPFKSKHLTMMIFSFVDVHHRSMSILR